MYIFQDRNGTYYLRIVLSDRIAKKVGQKELRRSLSTKSKRNAWKRLPALYAEAMQVIEGADSLNAKVVPNKEVAPLLNTVLQSYNEHQKRQGYRAKTITEKETAIELLIKITKNKPIDEYSVKDARAFRDTVLSLPPRFFRQLEKGYSFRKIIAEVNKKGLNTISITSYNNYIRAIAAVFSFAEKEEYIERNPFKGMKLSQNTKASTFKDVLKKEDIVRLFHYFKQWKDSRPERYWIPLICYYSGARLGEVAQAYKSDIKKVDGIWCLHITAERKDQRLKNLGSDRVIPLHSRLIEEGILEYMTSLESDRLFPLLKYSERHGYGGQLSMFFTKSVRKMEVEGKVSFHSLRHTFINTLKQKDVSEPIVGAIVGHNSGSSITFNRYGKCYPPETLKSVIEIVQYHGSQ